MELFAGKTTTERNKIITAIVLGALALIALFWAFGPSFRSRASSDATKPSPTPAPAAKTSTASQSNNGTFQLPSTEQEIREYTTTEVVYSGVSPGAADTSRNIFAFYEPPPPTPYSPTPVPTKTPTPPPPPPVQVAYVMPQNVYAGSGGFRMEVNGDKLPPDARVLFNGSQVPTSYLSPQKVVAEIPATLIGNPGTVSISVQSPADAKLYSNQVTFSIQEPPRPQFTYVGMVARKRYNNDTAYFLEQGKQSPAPFRLNDVVAGRFRLMSISSDETVLEDVNLGFRYKLALVKTGPSTGGAVGFPGGEYSMPSYPNTQGFPGIPPNVQYYPPRPQPQPGTRQPRPQQSPQKDVDKDKDADDDTDN